MGLAWGWHGDGMGLAWGWQLARGWYGGAGAGMGPGPGPHGVGMMTGDGVGMGLAWGWHGLGSTNHQLGNWGPIGLYWPANWRY
jgi:hypothetical protein